MRALHAVVSGRVQGVGYRATTQHEAVRRGLSGWVRNLASGDVEVQAEGDEDVLQDFLRYLKQGPRMARVLTVQVEWGEPQGAPQPFEVRKTV